MTSSVPSACICSTGASPGFYVAFFFLLGCNRKPSGIAWVLLYLCNKDLDVRQGTGGSRQLSEIIFLLCFLGVHCQLVPGGLLLG